MKAVIVAAGLGSRLHPYTDKHPKGLIEVDGQSLLSRSVEILSQHDFEACIIVTGYMSDRIPAALGDRCGDLPLIYVENPAYSTTGSMLSLLCAQEEIGESDILLLESDLLYADWAIPFLRDVPHGNALLTTPLLNNGDDVYVCTRDDGSIYQLGKKIPPEDMAHMDRCFIGISKFEHSFMRKVFVQAADEAEAGKRNFHYEETMLVASLASGVPLFAPLAKELHWTEIDNEADLQRARNVVWPKIQAERQTR